jgi:cob(I)alamin adenosyltransferase
VSIYINRVYTKSGDRGTTRLAGGQERKKDDPRLEAYGTTDELNAVLGVLLETMRASDRLGYAKTGHVRRIQNELFDLGGELATLAEDRHPKQALVTADDVARLEKEMDEANETLEPLRSFILPGGGMVSAMFHQARTVCRRAERCLISLHSAEAQREETIIYLNRLSDWFFVMGRSAAVASGEGEVLWAPGDRRME